MRGIHPFFGDRVLIPRIIPAHAGNTQIGLSASHKKEDHPRSCGEYQQTRKPSFKRKGSSPLMRGIRSKSNGLIWVSGIIPAHAGNTHRIRWFCVGCEDHPRSCGEYIKIHVSIPRFRGSSPLMRGILYRFVINVFRLGIIPAHAGNTAKISCEPSTNRDHPRSCGEYAFTNQSTDFP